MKGLKFYSAIILMTGFFLIQSCDTENNVESPDKNFFMKLYGRDGNQSGVDFISLNDGTFLLLGNSELGTSKRMYLVKTDDRGEVVWEKLLGTGSETAKDLEPTNDGNFIILSNFQKGADNTDIKLIRVTPDGNKIDSVTYGSVSNKNDNGQSVTPLLDGGFIVTGSTLHDEADFNPQDPDAYSNIFHFRCNASLVFDNVTWTQYYGNTGRYDAATKVFQESVNDFYVFGYSDKEHGDKTSDKLNLQYYSISGGGIVNNNESYLGYPYTGDTRAVFVNRVPSDLGGGFLIIGTETDATEVLSMRVAKLRTPLQFNDLDDIQFDKVISTGTRNLEAVSAIPSVISSRGYLLLANEVRTLGTRNIFLTKVDQSPQEQWSVSLGSETDEDRGAAVLELTNGKIMVLGTVGIGDNQSKMALFKLNSVGRLQD
jgi:hypothetical protein